MIQILHAQNNKKKPFFYVLYSDKTWVFDKPERAQGLIYIMNSDKNMGFDQSERAQGPIYIITQNRLYELYFIACRSYKFPENAKLA